MRVSLKPSSRFVQLALRISPHVDEVNDFEVVEHQCVATFGGPVIMETRETNIHPQKFMAGQMGIPAAYIYGVR